MTIGTRQARNLSQQEPKGRNHYRGIHVAIQTESIKDLLIYNLAGGIDVFQVFCMSKEHSGII